MLTGDANCVADANPLAAPIGCACCEKRWIKPEWVTKALSLTAATGTGVTVEEKPPTPKLAVAPFVCRDPVLDHILGPSRPVLSVTTIITALLQTLS